MTAAACLLDLAEGAREVECSAGAGVFGVQASLRGTGVSGTLAARLAAAGIAPALLAVPDWAELEHVYVRGDLLAGGALRWTVYVPGRPPPAAVHDLPVLGTALRPSRAGRPLTIPYYDLSELSFPERARRIDQVLAREPPRLRDGVARLHGTLSGWGRIHTLACREGGAKLDACATRAWNPVSACPVLDDDLRGRARRLMRAFRRPATYVGAGVDRAGRVQPKVYVSADEAVPRRVLVRLVVQEAASLAAGGVQHPPD